ncbi:MAG: rhamnulokinase, partial [Bacteroidales bacterium]|nr:rhamnulokinase [Bacteroidales bacterium]
TWSLMGVELPEPCINEASYKASFTNEGGIEHTTRFLKNITGLWLLQECKRQWDKDSDYSYAEMAELSMKAHPFKCFIDPDDPVFLNPDNMIKTIQDYCRKSDQPVPESVAEISRCIFESLAMKYRYTLNQLRAVTGRTINRIHLIGGGSQNQILSQFTASATALEVIAGSAESTALGNILLQAKAMGILANRQDMREIVRKSVETQVYHPSNKALWAKKFDHFCMLTGLYPAVD